MTMTDPIADMLTRLRNANQAYHDSVAMPYSKLKAGVAEILQQEGYITAYDVKDNTDSGQYLGIQEACAYCLDHPEQTQKIAAKYSRRMDALVQVLNKHGFNARKPRGSFFLYVKAPTSATTADGKRVAFEKGESFSQWMITEKLVSTVPWDDAGAYVRFSVTFIAKDEADERRLVE